MTHRDLNPLEEELLGILQEECAEVIHIISKIRRFGLMSFSNEDPSKTSNHANFVLEVGDVMGVIDLIMGAHSAGQSPLFNSEQLNHYSKKKQRKVKAILKMISDNQLTPGA